jgi:hypothetical protein
MNRIHLLFLPLLAGLFAYQTPGVNTSVEIAAAQTWWQNSSHANTVFLGYTLQPDWSGAQVSKPAADRLIIDIPLVGGGLFDMAKQNPQTGQINPAHKNGATRLVITKIGNSNYIPLLFHAFGTPEYITEHGVQAANMVKPHAVPSSFTGNLFYTRLDGEAFSGIFVENGQVKGTLTPVQPGSVTPRSCSLIETICAGYGENILCVHFVLCEVFDGPGGAIIIGGNNGSWWGNGPIEDCNGCIGGGFVPPLCPDGSAMPGSGICLCSDGAPMPLSGVCEEENPCKVNNTWHTTQGPTVTVYMVGVKTFYAYTDVLLKLLNCKTGSCDQNILITGGDGGQVTNFNLVKLEQNHDVQNKLFHIKTKNYVTIFFEAIVNSQEWSQYGNGVNHSDYYLNYN